MSREVLQDCGTAAPEPGQGQGRVRGAPMNIIPTLSMRFISRLISRVEVRLGLGGLLLLQLHGRCYMESTCNYIAVWVDCHCRCYMKPAYHNEASTTGYMLQGQSSPFLGQTGVDRQGAHALDRQVPIPLTQLLQFPQRHVRWACHA